MTGNLVDNPVDKNRRFLVAFDYDSTIREVKDTPGLKMEEPN